MRLTKVSVKTLERRNIWWIGYFEVKCIPKEMAQDLSLFPPKHQCLLHWEYV